MPYADKEKQKEFQQRWHQENKDRRREADRIRKVRDKEIIREKKNKPCADCRETYPFYVMQFDHVEDNKEHTISRLVANRQIKKALLEIEKCEVVCANCHATRTYLRAIDRK